MVNNPTFSSLGKYILNLRTTQKKSREQVAFETCIPIKQLILIEENKSQFIGDHYYTKRIIENLVASLDGNIEYSISLYNKETNSSTNRHEYIKKTELSKNLEKKTAIEYIRSINFQKYLKSFNLNIAFLLLIPIILFFVWNIFLGPFVQKPDLKITFPIELNAPYSGKLAWDQNFIAIDGFSESGSIVKINNIPISLNSDFTFSSGRIPITEEITQLEISAENSFGAKSSIKINLEKSTKDTAEYVVSIKSKSDTASVKVLLDGELVFDGLIQNTQEQVFAPTKYIEIVSDEFANLEVYQNNEKVELQSPNTIIQNN